MDNKLSPNAKTGLIGLVALVWAIGVVSCISIQYIFGSDTSIDQKQHEQLVKDIANQKLELKRLSKLKKTLVDTSSYRYEAEISFSTTIIDANDIESKAEETNLSVLIPISREFYQSTKDSTVIKSNTKTVGEPIQYLNISKLKLLKRSRYEIN